MSETVVSNKATVDVAPPILSAEGIVEYDDVSSEDMSKHSQIMPTLLLAGEEELPSAIFNAEESTDILDLTNNTDSNYNDISKQSSFSLLDKMAIEFHVKSNMGKAKAAKKSGSNRKRTTREKPVQNKNKKPEATPSEKIRSDWRYIESPYITLPQSQIKNISSNDEDPSVISEMVGLSFQINNPTSLHHKMKDLLSNNCTAADVDHVLQEEFGSLFKPQIKYTSKSSDLANMNTKCPWVCVFCARDSTFLKIGPLYGPYYLSDDELLSVPDWAKECPESSNKSYEHDILKLIVRKREALESGDNKAITYSSEVASSSISTMKQSMRSNKNNKVDDVKTIDDEDSSLYGARISFMGDVWFHLECILWAPGTSMHGDGTFNGLKDILPVALNTKCTCCSVNGAMLGCRERGCGNTFHYLCARNSNCEFIESDYIITCEKHKKKHV